MTANEVREKYLKFFEKKGHKIIPPAPLVLENDPTTLFTSSGMQPLVPYLMGETHPEGKRLVDSQPSIRVQDIEEVGDNRHTTFFEMLGNWSLGDYFKKEQLGWIWEFLTEELGLPKEKLYVSIFEGNSDVPRDDESYERWIELGVAKDHIFEYGVKKNWWSRSGTPEQMPAGEIGGPDSEIFLEFDSVKHNKKFGDECHPNCDCGRFLEIGNSVFIQYKKKADGSLEELPQKNVDFGGGLERLVAATENQPDIFMTSFFKFVMDRLESEILGPTKGSLAQSSVKILVDHIRAAAFLIKDGVRPSNKMQGYILRRLLRRAAIKNTELGRGNYMQLQWLGEVSDEIVSQYKGSGYFSEQDKIIVREVIDEEMRRFGIAMDKGLNEIQKLTSLDGKIAFDLYQNYGFPLELTLELAQEKGIKVEVHEFKKAFEEHQEKSRTASAGTFKGGLADHSNEVTALHTATHLLHQALRTVLGDHVQQKGSNITAERLRFDFTHDQKLTDEQKKEIEDLINKQIDKDLEVTFETKTLDEAKAEGALAFFGERYAEKVKVYSIGEFSKEVCGGPHVAKLSDLHGHVTIIKEEAASSGVRRIYAKIV